MIQGRAWELRKLVCFSQPHHWSNKIHYVCRTCLYYIFRNHRFSNFTVTMQETQFSMRRGASEGLDSVTSRQGFGRLMVARLKKRWWRTGITASSVYAIISHGWLARVDHMLANPTWKFFLAWVAEVDICGLQFSMNDHSFCLVSVLFIVFPQHTWPLTVSISSQ